MKPLILKRILPAVCLSLLALLGLATLFNKAPLPNTSVILQAPTMPALDYTLFYTTPDLSSIQAYDLMPLHTTPLSPSKTSYLPYTEGFLEKNIATELLQLIKKNNHLIDDYFHDYYVDDDVHYLAFTGGLERLFAINPITQSVLTPHYLPSQDLGKMYVSSMRVVDDTLIVAGAKAHSYELLVYTFDKETFQLTSQASLDAPPKVMNDRHFFISPSGLVHFLGEGMAVYSYNPFTKSLTSTALAIEGSELIPFEDSFSSITTSQELLQLDSPLLDSPLHFPLPTSTCLPMAYHITDTQLVALFFDPLGMQFQNYFCVYDLSDLSFAYLLGLEGHRTLQLSNMLIPIDN